VWRIDMKVKKAAKGREVEGEKRGGKKEDLG
jgi:hypothetical protein